MKRMKSFLIKELKIKKIWVVGLIVLMVGVWNNLNFAESGSTSSSSLKMLWNIISPGKSTYKAGSEPDGFRGIKWGTYISTLKGMEYVRTAPILGGVKIYIYKRQGDVLQIGKAKLESIEYQFWKGRFCGVAVYFSGYVNWSGLKDALFEKFGKGHQPDKSRESYFWFGTKTKIMVGYNKKTEAGILSMESMKILKEKMEAYRKYRKKK